MIVSVPEYKKIYNIQQNKLNESGFDLFDDDDDILNIEGHNQIADKISADYERETIAPKVEFILRQLNVENYEIKCTGDGILVDVHDNLYLPNRGLNKMGTLFKFDRVDGSCNYTGNNLTDWTMFPFVIVGNCYANFNNIKNFNGVPRIGGKLFATKQNKKPEYPLTNENYRKFKSNNLSENDVYVKTVNKFGMIYSINEKDNSCIILFTDNTKLKFKTYDVEYLGNLENLIL